jgi:hypothetical protein
MSDSLPATEPQNFLFSGFIPFCRLALALSTILIHMAFLSAKAKGCAFYFKPYGSDMAKHEAFSKRTSAGVKGWLARSWLTSGKWAPRVRLT